MRQQFLDYASAETSTEEGSTEPSTERHEWLKEARLAAQEDNPKTLSVRDLLRRWDAARRGYLITRQVAADLANHSLCTSPDFEAVNLDAEVRLVCAPIDSEEALDPEQAAGTVPAALHDDEDSDPVVGLTVGNLPSALGGVVAVSPTATFEEAITKMAVNGFSQLPVLAGSRTLRGAVTWESIARARQVDAKASFSSAICHAYEAPYDRYLIDILPQLADLDFVLVRDQTSTIAGIVTTNDVAAVYGAMATPFFLIGEFDQRLRRIVSDTFGVEHVTTLCDPDGDRKVTSYDDLSIGDYQRVLQDKDAWGTLGWPLDRKVIVERMDEIREIRNDLMHFNPDPLPEDAVQKIRHMIALLREYGR